MHDIDVLLRLYEEDLTQSGLFQEMRAQITNWVILITGAILAVLTHGPNILHLSRADLPLTLFLLCIGLLGALVSQQFHEHIHFYDERGRKYRSALDRELTKPGAIEALDRSFKDTRHSRLYWIWVSMHLLAASIGLGLTIIAFAS
jgi:hypothetical protein